MERSSSRKTRRNVWIRWASRQQSASMRAGGTIAHSILAAHTVTDDLEHLRIKFDAMASHDITYVGIIQTARASVWSAFPPLRAHLLP